MNQPVFNDPLRPMLAEQSLLLLDGALATELERRGCNLNDPLWSARVLLEEPALIRQVHLDYFLAGADVATTASYQATFEGFARRGLSETEARDLMHRAVALAIEARDTFWAEPSRRTGRPRPLVAASVGPYGAMLADGSEYRGHYGLSVEALMDFHRPRMAALIEAGPDLLACETLPCLDEALAIARLLRDAFPATPAWISFSCRDDAHTSQGERFDACVEALAPFEQVVAIGINCTAPAHIPPLLHSAAGCGAKPLLVYPNSGETYDAEHKCWHGIRDAQAFAEAALGWKAAGARLIGGCCRTTPEDIAALAAAVRGG